MGENTEYLPVANSPRTPLTPRSLRSRYSLWLSIGAFILATCALVGTICRMHMDIKKPNAIEDPFYKSDVRSFLTVGRGRPRPLLIAEEDLSVEDLAVIYGDRLEDRQDLLTRLQNTASRRFEGFMESWSKHHGKDTQHGAAEKKEKKKKKHDDIQHS